VAPALVGETKNEGREDQHRSQDQISHKMHTERNQSHQGEGQWVIKPASSMTTPTMTQITVWALALREERPDYRMPL
jgi:predicted GNAT family acetyltransferase